MRPDERVAETVAAYDRAAEAYHEQAVQARPADALRRFARMAGRDSLVLDVAAGPALDVRGLRDAGLQVVAGDRSEESMRLCKKLFPRGRLARWDFRSLPFPDAVFDGVWAPAALQHVPRAQMRPALGELRRVQRSGPIFAAFREGSDDLAPADEPAVGTVYATTVSADELRALLLDGGYEGVEVETRPDPHGRADVTWLYGWGLAGSAR